MGKLTKNQKLALSKIEPGKAYTLAEAAEKVKEITFTEQVNRFVYLYCVIPTQRQPPKKPALTM